MACTCKVGPGKFEGESALTFMAYQQMCLGNSDYSVGRYDFFKAPFMFDADRSVVKAALDYGFCQECIDNHANGEYGCVVYDSDQGFAYCHTYETEAEYDAAVKAAEEEVSDDQEAF